MITEHKVSLHFQRMGNLPLYAEVTGDSGTLSLADGFISVIKTLKKTHKKGNTVWVIGNGGSASIASHIAEDFTKNGNIRTMAFNDASLLTCFANDYGYVNAFKEMIKQYAKKGDTLIAISSSGNSQNIRGAADIAQKMGLHVCTFSGFNKDNHLRLMGNINFYVQAFDYGSVEVTHLSLLHGILDMIGEVA